MSEFAPPDHAPASAAPHPTDAARISASYRRVIIFACLLPILAMVVIGASRFDAILAISVRPAPTDIPDDGLPLLDVRPLPEDTRLLDQTPYASSAADAAAASTRISPDRPAVRVVRTVLMEVTAYCPCTRCCGEA